MIVLAQFFWDGMLFLWVGAALGFLLCLLKERSQQRAAGAASQILLDNARRDAEALLRDARLAANESALKIRDQQEQTLSAQRQEMVELEQRLEERESLVNQQLEGLLRRQQELLDKDRDLQSRHSQLDQRQLELNDLLQRENAELHRLAHLTEADARALVLKHAQEEALRDATDLSRKILEESKTRAEDEARRILSVAIQRYAGDHTFETTTTTVALQGDDIKGRIIGREGRNIRAFEAATGVTVLIDDTPNAVVLSGFDPVRREIARESMQRLILDGRIHPTRIEEVVSKVTEEIDEAILKTGEEAVYQLGLPPIHVELVKLLGKLRFRRSFSQNILNHSIEVGHLTGLLAAELGLDLTLARKAGLLHDIGKALSHELEGTHAAVGADIVRRHGETEDIVNAIASHHGEVPATSLYGILVSAADAISASRPGARSETMATYIKRLDDLEQIGMSFKGVEKCFAVQAGRELRVMVQPETISDDQAYFLARVIARRIEEILHYPGQIRVTVLRETRCIEFAK